MWEFPERIWCIIHEHSLGSSCSTDSREDNYQKWKIACRVFSILGNMLYIRNSSNMQTALLRSLLLFTEEMHGFDSLLEIDHKIWFMSHLIQQNPALESFSYHVNSLPLQRILWYYKDQPTKYRNQHLPWVTVCLDSSLLLQPLLVLPPGDDTKRWGIF